MTGNYEKQNKKKHAILINLVRLPITPNGDNIVTELNEKHSRAAKPGETRYFMIPGGLIGLKISMLSSMFSRCVCVCYV